MYTYEEWVEFHKKKGIGTSTVDSLDWLLKGCPICGCKEWDVTNDGWCYCDGCSQGFCTYGIWINVPLAHYNKDGFSCFMCHGTGKEINSGDVCHECDARFEYLDTGD